MRTNYHTHTFRCKHASGDTSDYAFYAVREGMSVLGMADHTPLPGDRWIEMRMYMSELDDYCNSIDHARKQFPELIILKGMECEYAPEFHSFYRDELLGSKGFDYLAGSSHFYPYKGYWENSWGSICTPKELWAYAEYIVDTMKSGLFTFIAHPDMFGNSYKMWDSEAVACSRYILEAAEATGTALEINSYGFRKPPISTPAGVRPMYPWKPFWELAAEYDIRALVNSDAHRPQDIIAKTDEAMEFVREFGLKLADLSYLERRYEKAVVSEISIK